MALVSATVALLIFGAILVVSIGLAWWMSSYKAYESSNFHTFISILAGLGVFVTFMFYFNVVALQNEQQELTAAQELGKLNDGLINSILDEINESSMVIPNFIASITPLTACEGLNGEDPANSHTSNQKLVLSYRIFAVWQDFISSSRRVHFEPVPYLCGFLQRGNSRQLLYYWEKTKLDYNNDTKTLGDLIFEYGLPITEQIPANYSVAAEKLSEDPRFLALIS